MNEYTGEIVHFFCQREDFIIAKWKSDNGELFTIKGSLYGVDKGEQLTIRGSFLVHSKYGNQFEISEWERPLPKTKDQIISFLSSKYVKGCGIKRAELIVQYLGEDAVNRIMSEGAHILLSIKGFGIKHANQITDSVKNSFELQKIAMKLLPYGLTINMVSRIYKRYGNESVAVIQKNPFKLTELDMIGFLKADEIAEAVGISPTSPFRIDAGIQYVLNESCYSGGHCFLPVNQLLDKTSSLLSRRKIAVSKDVIEQSLIELAANELIVWEEDKVYPKHLHHYEVKLAQKLTYLVCQNGEAMPSIENLIKQYQTRRQIVLAEKQREVIRKLFEHRFLVLTGNPGTGKTTVVKSMIELYRKVYPKHRIGLAGLLGRVARNLKKITGLEAETVHMMLGFRPGGDPDYNEELPLPYDLIFVDESSMADIQIAYHFFQAVGPQTKVVWIGDSDQLPAVGPGNVLRDMIEAGVPNVRLTEIFRQAQDSQIIMNAHRINQGKPIVIDPLKDDFFFIEQSDPEKIAHLIERSFLRFIDKGYSSQDILVLSPMKKGVIGTEELNQRLQASVNPPSTQKEEWTIGERTYRVGDKIIKSAKNDYEKGVMNGDIGIVIAIGFLLDEDGNETDEKALICRIEGKEVRLSHDDMKHIQLAYASTIHKIIGGQAPVVILPISTSHYRMLCRNLYYTGSTRAEEVCVMIGTKKALLIAVSNNEVVKRNTGLKDRLVQLRARAELTKGGRAIP